MGVGDTAGASYRPEIDGLRALAVVAVILHHFHEGLLPSGFLGVDVFFVISGFVITASLGGRPAASRRDLLLGFYSRRVKRIVPALVVCVVGTGLAATLLAPGAAASFATGVAALFGVSNLHLLREATDYFGASAELDLFTQTWSLGVEEQFYLLFPLVVWGTGFGRASAAGARHLSRVVALFGIASLAGFVALNSSHQAVAYYLMPTRLWEIGAGCLLALHAQGALARPSARAPAWLSLAALASLIAVLFAPRRLAVEATVAAVALTALAVATVRPATAAYRLLTLPSCRFVGRVSYSLYLWHWSVLALSRWTVGIDACTAPLQGALMLLLAAVSTRFIEEPLRRAEWSAVRWRAIAYGLAACAVAGGVLLALRESPSVRRAAGADDRNADWLGNGTTLTQANCHAKPNPNSRRFRANCRLPAANGQTVLAVGDSQTGHLVPLLSRLHLRDGVGIDFFSDSAQPFPSVPHATSAGRSLATWRRKNQRMERFFGEHLAQLARGDLVVLSSRFELDWTPYPLNRSQRDGTVRKYFDERGAPISKAEAFVRWQAAVGKVAAACAERGVTVVVFAPVPVFEEVLAPVPGVGAGFRRDEQEQGLDRAFVVRHYAELNAALAELARTHANLRVFDTLDAVCPASLSTCRPSRDGVDIYRDQWHLSNAGSNALYEPFRAFLAGRGLLRSGAPRG